MPAKYSFKIKLTGFINSQIIEVEDEYGERQQGVFIPAKLNELYFSDDNTVYANAIAFPSRAPGSNHSHCLLPCFSEEHRAMLKEFGYTRSNLGYMTYMGNAEYYKKKK